MENPIIVNQSSQTWIEDYPVEIVERKGIGHPDTLCDGIAERISVAYTRWCLANLGAQLHHNFDKVQLVAGEVALTYGGGQMLKPLHIQIAGRGTPFTPDGHPVPLDLIAIGAAKAYLRETMRHLDPEQHCVIDCFAGRGDSQLIQAVEQVTANDTSFGVGHWPLSELERTVYETSLFFNNQLIDRFPIGEDVKVMGLRRTDRITLTCAVPFLAPEVHDAAHYRDLKAAVQAEALAFASELNSRQTALQLNTADSGADDSAYLTLTGTSAEMGDDGAVGRGNRTTGLITPFRPVSLEAAAGKNPVSHVGKIYNLLALQAAKRITAEVPGLRQVEIYVLSQIGRPVDQPQVALVNALPVAGDLTPSQVQDITALLGDSLANLNELRAQIADQAISLF